MLLIELNLLNLKLSLDFKKTDFIFIELIDNSK